MFISCRAGSFHWNMYLIHFVSHCKAFISNFLKHICENASFKYWPFVNNKKHFKYQYDTQSSYTYKKIIIKPNHETPVFEPLPIKANKRVKICPLLSPLRCFTWTKNIKQVEFKLNCRLHWRFKLVNLGLILILLFTCYGLNPNSPTGL